jgi:hypothetical protein
MILKNVTPKKMSSVAMILSVLENAKQSKVFMKLISDYFVILLLIKKIKCKISALIQNVFMLKILFKKESKL